MLKLMLEGVVYCNNDEHLKQLMLRYGMTARNKCTQYRQG